MAGKMAKVFWAWERVLEESQVPAVLFENVLGFDLSSVQNGFKPFKVLMNLEVHPNKLGNAILRARRKCGMTRVGCQASLS